MKLICQECGTIIKANDINLKDQIAKCMACNEVFSFKNSKYYSLAPPSSLLSNFIGYLGLNKTINFLVL